MEARSSRSPRGEAPLPAGAAGGDRGDRCATISLVVALRALVEQGLASVDVRRRLAATLSLDDVDQLQNPSALPPAVPLSAAAAFFAVVDDVTGDQHRDAVAARWCTLHPTLRALSVLAATPLGWLDLCWRALDALHPLAAHAWHAEDDGALTLRVRPWSPSGASSSTTKKETAAWLRWAHAIAQQAPLAIGATALRPVHMLVDDDGLVARYAIAQSVSAAARVARATGVPLRCILQTLAALPVDVVAAVNDDVDDGDDVALAAFSRRHGLTAAEARVVCLLHDGLAPAEVARELDITTGTVRVHLKRAYAKTGARGQRALLALVDGAQGAQGA